MNKMDLNPVKKLKISNSPASESLENVDELNSGKKMISKLNVDCLAKVMMYISILDRLEMENVCEKWREASELSWYAVKKLNLNDLIIRLDEKKEIFKKIMWRCCRYLTHLTMNDDHYPWVAHILKDNCHKMIHFHIDAVHESKIPAGELAEIIKSMSQLKYFKVSIRHLAGLDTISFDEVLKVLPRDMKEINLIAKLDWGWGSVELPDRFENLQFFTLQNMFMDNKILEPIMPSKDTLTHLDLSKCQFPWDELQTISNFKNLERLILSSVDGFNVDAITSIARNCSKLKHFQVTKLDDDAEDELPYHIYRELRYLNLEYLECDVVFNNENIISGLGDNWKELKHLNVGKGLHFSLLDVQEITKFKNLEYLNISGAKINSESFINIITNCRELKELHWRKSGYISQIALENLSNLKKLEKLNFADFKDLTGNLLSKIVKNCENLVKVDVRGCKNITEDSLIQVGKLEHLKKLIIDRIPNVPNKMFDYFRKLEQLSCRGCPNVTDEGIITVIDNCKKLFKLELWRTGITVKCLVHASYREFVYTGLTMIVDRAVRDAYEANYFTISPGLEIFS